MAIAMTLRDYLAKNDIDYETVTHPYAASASRAAEQSHVSGEQVAKAVLLKRGQDYVLAVLPASHRIMFDALRDCLDKDVTLATEEEIEAVFTDCELGAIPPVGYGLEVLIDQGLTLDSDVYFEGGDHATLVRVAAESFAKLMKDAKRGYFSRHVE